MSQTSFNNLGRRVEIRSTGRQGLRGYPGVTWIDDPWQSGTEYAEHEALYHDGTSYRVTVAHTAAEATEPGVGADWQTVWVVLALGSDVESVGIVAGIAGEIEVVAGIKDDVVAVAAIKDDVSTVAGAAADVSAVAARDAAIATVAARDADIGTVAARDAAIGTVAARDADIATVAGIDSDVSTVAGISADVETVADGIAGVETAAANITAINGAAQAATDAATARDKAQDWAEGTEPGGSGTKSAKEHAGDAADSAEIADDLVSAVEPSIFAAAGVASQATMIAGQLADGVAKAISASQSTSQIAYAIDIAAQGAHATSGGRARLAGGTLASPSLQIGTVSIYSSAANTLSIAIAGVERARFTAAGLTVYGTVTEV